MFLIESRWNPNFCVKSKKISSISSLERGIWRSAVQAGYGSRAPGGPAYSAYAVAVVSDKPTLGPNDSEDAGGYRWP